MKATILQGDVMDRLRELPDESVHCVVTSPPYWGLRDYGIPPSVWGGDPACVHDWDVVKHVGGGKQHSDKVRWQHTGHGEHGHALSTSGFCSKCGAWLGCFGLEPTPELYVEHAVMIFREARRVLRKDGTLWMNVGDSYWGGKGQSNYAFQERRTSTSLEGNQHNITGMGQTRPQDGRHPEIKPKDLVGIPWMLAFALRSDGWWLRQDIIWHKPNPMPESVRDRCTKSHEYIFLFAKSERYYYDNESIREPITAPEASTPEDLIRAHNRRRETTPEKRQNKIKVPGGWEVGPGTHGTIHPRGRTAATYIERPVGEKLQEADGDENRASASARFGRGAGWRDDPTTQVDTRNKRSVWTVATSPFPEAHFATFPPDLIEPCILAGCPEGGIVLDTFNGSGTTGMVALRLHREYIGIDIKPDYVKMAERRITNDAPLLNTVEVQA